MACDCKLYKEVSKTKSQRLTIDFIIKCSAVQLETEYANLVGIDSYSEPALYKRSRMTSDDNSE